MVAVLNGPTSAIDRAEGAQKIAPASQIENFANALQDAMHSFVGGRGFEAVAIQHAEVRHDFSVQQQQSVSDRPSGNDDPEIVKANAIDGRHLYSSFSAGGNERAARGVSIGEGVSDNAITDPIRDGLGTARGMFDEQVNKVHSAGAGSMSGSEALIAAQYELTKFSLVLDVSSKLLGKATQTVDTLMKGS